MLNRPSTASTTPKKKLRAYKNEHTVLGQYRSAVLGLRPGAECRRVKTDWGFGYQIVSGDDSIGDVEADQTIAWREAEGKICDIDDLRRIARHNEDQCRLKVQDAVARLRAQIDTLPNDSTVTDISVGDIRLLITAATVG